MRSENKKFRVELGINLHAAPVPQTNPNMRIFPLQNALIDITGGEASPAWYSRLGIADEICFRLVDISNRRELPAQPEYPQLALTELYFSNPSTGQSSNPFTEDIVRWRISERRDDQASPVYSRHEEHLLPTWDILGRTGGGEWLESLVFDDFVGAGEDGDGCEEDEAGRFRAFELAVVIRMVQDGWVDHYVFDPEMIISETDNEGDQGGG